MSQKFESIKSFRKWHEAGFGTELLPIAPPDATIARGSTIRPEHLGKTPAVRNRDGTWSGLGGRWSQNLFPGVPELKEWGGWGASVGHQGRGFPLLDVDTDNPKAATAIEGLAVEYLGMTPVRERDGSSRRLLFYKLKEGAEPIRKTRLAWRDAKGVKHAVELLGLGQQAVVEGPHPKGMMYRWRGGESPCEWGADNLTEIDADDVARFFEAVTKLVEDNGGEILRGVGAAATGVLAQRKGLDDPLLWAPRPELVIEVLDAWPNSADTLPTHDDFVQALAAIKAALGPKREEFYPDVEQWAAGYEGNDGDYIRKTWDSLADASLGWEWLARHGAPGVAAQVDFDERGNESIGKTVLDKMLDRYVYASNIDRYADLKTGELLTSKAFNSRNVVVAQFGCAGIKSAEATFQNLPGARKAALTTYRPGMPALMEDTAENGARLKAVNLWRPSDIEPLTNVGDETVRPWLIHVELLLGAPGSPAREHFLDWCVFLFQYPGHKINHALVILGEPGIGKDTALTPVLQAIGMHNVSMIKTENLIGPWTHFLQAQIVVVQEMMNFSKRELYNKMKDWLATPPMRLEVNRKHLHQYTVPNVQNWVFFTNHDDAIALDTGDRRFWVHRCLVDIPREPAYYDALYRWYNDRHGPEKVAGWLLARDVSQFDPHAAPPITDAKQEMTTLALASAVRWLQEQLGAGGAFAHRTLIATRELVEHARTAFDAPSKVSDMVRDKHAVAALKRAGYEHIDMKLRLPSGNLMRLWTNNPRLAQLEHRELVQRYAHELANGEAGKGVVNVGIS